jgi:hypothetical protein
VPLLQPDNVEVVEYTMRLNLGRIPKACCLLFMILSTATLEGCDHFQQGAAVRSASVSPKNAKAVCKSKAVSKQEAATRPRAASGFPLPVRELLAAPAAPDCEFHGSDPNADERQKLDYERQCYRHAEIIARDRLARLQSSVRAMTVDHCQWSATRPGELEPFDVAED